MKNYQRIFIKVFSSILLWMIATSLCLYVLFFVLFPLPIEGEIPCSGLEESFIPAPQCFGVWHKGIPYGSIEDIPDYMDTYEIVYSIGIGVSVIIIPGIVLYFFNRKVLTKKS